MILTRLTGTIRSYDEPRGCGHIDPDDGGPSIFFIRGHIRGHVSPGDVAAGRKVSFSVNERRAMRTALAISLL